MRKKYLKRNKLALERAASLPPASPQLPASPQRPASPEPSASPPASPVHSSPPRIAEELQSDGSGASVATIVLNNSSAHIVSDSNEQGFEEDTACTSDNV